MLPMDDTQADDLLRELEEAEPAAAADIADRLAGLLGVALEEPADREPES
jgi:hypothetical protein